MGKSQWCASPVSEEVELGDMPNRLSDLRRIPRDVTAIGNEKHEPCAASSLRYNRLGITDDGSSQPMVAGSSPAAPASLLRLLRLRLTQTESCRAGASVPIALLRGVRGLRSVGT